MTTIEEISINTIRFLAADAIEKAKSGHPGMPMGAAAAGYTLFYHHLKHNPRNPHWPDRDRFVLSAGHGSMLLYALLYLSGYDLSLDDLKSFRQWGSKTPGHPERNHPSGTEVTTGPLGQGISNAVGMAIAEAHLSSLFNRPGFNIVDHFTYVMASDGDLMEGVSYEACALAGHLGLGKLIVLYDNNGVTLAGGAALTMTEDTKRRFEAMNWQFIEVADGNDVGEINQALLVARREMSRPTLISLRTSIGYGAPGKQNSCAAHGAPLGEEVLKKAKECLNWPLRESFFVPEEVKAHFNMVQERGKIKEEEWEKLFSRYESTFPELAREFKRRMKRELPPNWDECLKDLEDKWPNEIATRKASETVMQRLATTVPELIGGSADLNPSTFTWLKGMGDFQNPHRPHDDIEGKVGGPWGYEGRNLHFGVREHAMGAIAVGLALHGGVIPYTATFLTFADYMRPPMRLAALMGLPVIFIFTHDSIGVGEDGPTHQPVEHLMSLRSIPNLTVIRPCDAAEVVEAWRIALLNEKGPTALIFTRQNTLTLDRKTLASACGLTRGGYILWENTQKLPEVIIIATGSEVAAGLKAAYKLAEEGIAVRVVSLPCWELFDAQPAEYRQGVLPGQVERRIAVEAGIKLGWEHYVGLRGSIVGMDSFGASAPSGVLYEKFGLTWTKVYEEAKRLLSTSL